MRRQALYLGGFLGPFGGGVLTVLIPELRDRFDTSTTAVTLAAITAYILPFAVFQLVSGTIGERLGTARTIRTAYVAYAAVSVLAAFVTSLIPFAIARAAQGTCNAFTDAAAARRARRDDGGGDARSHDGHVRGGADRWASCRRRCCGGLAGAIDERLAFIVPAAVALGLAAIPVPVAARDAHARPPSLRSAVNERVWWAAAAAFLAYLAVTGIGFLVSIRAADSFGLGPTARGLLLAGFGFSGVIAGRPAGNLVDRRGRVAITTAGATACAVFVPLLGIVQMRRLDGRRVDRRRRGVRADLGRAQHAHGPRRAGQPRRCGLVHRRVEVRGQRRRDRRCGSRCTTCANGWRSCSQARRVR